MSAGKSVLLDGREADAKKTALAYSIMAVAAQKIVGVPLSGPRSQASEAPSTITALIEKSVAAYSQSPYLGYPKTARGKADYVYHTYQQINGYANEAAWCYAEAGLSANVRLFLRSRYYLFLAKFSAAPISIGSRGCGSLVAL